MRVFQLRDGDVRACVVRADLAVDLDIMADMSEPVAQAYLDALALCEAESVATLWVHDPLCLFPQRDRPELELYEPVRPLVSAHTDPCRGGRERVLGRETNWSSRAANQARGRAGVGPQRPRLRAIAVQFCQPTVAGVNEF